ncbi:MAG: hypothetical protein ABFR05_02750 [Bacteroidota bacterium]
MEKKDPLLLLVKSLSKSEKRQFKLYAGRLGVNSQKNFMALFSLLEKMEVIDESVILKKTNIKKQQLSNAKAHLYKQILISLRLNPSHHNIMIQIREQLDFATILYNKGLHKQSLKVLEKAKNMALQNFENNLAFEIVELEKAIESQYITRSMSSRADDLTTQSEMLIKRTVRLSKLSNLSLQLYSMMLKKGYVRDDEDYQKVKRYFDDNLPICDIEDLGTKERLFLYKAYLWYNFMTQDFVSCYRYAQKWVDLFHENPKMKETNPIFYLKGTHYLLEALFLIQHSKKFKNVLEQFKAEFDNRDFHINDNTSKLAFLIYYQNKINLFFLEGQFTKGLDFIPEVLEELKMYRKKFDEHHIMVFYYKIASLYFGAGDYDSCIFYLEKIIKNKELKMREDLLCFSRILNLVAHYEAGLDEDMDYLIKSTYRFLIKMDDLHIVQKKIISFLRNLGNVFPHEMKKEFVKLHEELAPYENHPYEKRSFMYLDIISWLESKIQNRSVESIIQEKARMKIK